MREVLLKNRDGDVVMKCSSVREAAAVLHVTAASVISRIRLKTVRNGIYAEYCDGNEYAPYRYKRVRKSTEVEKDCLSREDMEKLVKEYAEKGVEMECVKYELRFGMVSITPCMKRECGSDFKRVAVGSVGCVACGYFAGKCKEEQVVLCRFRSCCYRRTDGVVKLGRPKKK